VKGLWFTAWRPVSRRIVSSWRVGSGCQAVADQTEKEERPCLSVSSLLNHLDRDCDCIRRLQYARVRVIRISLLAVLGALAKFEWLLAKASSSRSSLECPKKLACESRASPRMGKAIIRNTKACVTRARSRAPRANESKELNESRVTLKITAVALVQFMEACRGC